MPLTRRSQAQNIVSGKVSDQHGILDDNEHADNYLRFKIGSGSPLFGDINQERNFGFSRDLLDHMNFKQ